MPTIRNRILLVDDNRLLLEAVTPRLIDAGFVVTTAASGKEAIDHLQAQSFDLILLDWVMPDINGFQVLQETKKMNIQTPIIMFSSFGQEEQEKGAKELGLLEIFDKANTPIDEVIKYIQKVLNA